MDILEFQNKLKEIQTLAVNNGKKVHAQLVEKFFDDPDMDGEKIKRVYDYLETQGIRVEGILGGADSPSRQEQVERSAQPEKERIPLTREEEEYLQEYLETMGAREEAAEEALFEQFFRGERAAREALTRLYQREVVEAAKDFNREELFFGDLLQEGNMGLLMALENAGEQEDLGSRITEEIRNAVRSFVEEQTRQKKEDDILVERVRTLEAKVKELTEDDKDIKYSVEELALFLDMDVEDIRSVLRLTGEE